MMVRRPSPCAVFAGWLAVVLLVLLLLCGALPFSAIEGDDQGVMNGMAEYARGAEAVVGIAYSPHLQPGTYALAGLLQRFSGCDGAVLYPAMSLVAALGVILLGALLGRRLLGLPLLPGLLVALFCQELLAAAAYANSSTLGALFALAGLHVLAEGAGSRVRLGLCAVLLALGGWCRIDTLALAPLAWVVVYREDLRWLGLPRLALLALVTLLTLLLLLHGSGVTPALIWATLDAKGPSNSLGYTLGRCYLLTSLPLTCLAAFGALWSLFRREWALVAGLLLVFVPLFMIHGRAFDSTKYFYCGVPLLAWSATRALHWLWVSGGRGLVVRRRLVMVAAMVVLLDGFSSFRHRTPLEPGWHVHPLLTVSSTSPGGRSGYDWTIGPGDPVATGDAFRLRGGAVIGTLEWSRQKRLVAGAARAFDAALAGEGDRFFLCSTYFSFQYAVGALRKGGFGVVGRECPFPGNPSTVRQSFLAEGRRVTLVLVNHTDSRAREMRELTAGLPSHCEAWFFCDLGKTYAGELLLASGREWTLASPDPDAGLALYRLLR